MASTVAPYKVLHLHSTFAAGGKELRAVQLMNAFGGQLHHSVVSSMPEQMGAAEHLDRGIRVAYPKNFPALTGLPTPGRLVAIAEAMKPYDLVLTYNWGAINAVMAHTVFRDAMALPPLIHHEDGFNEDEVEQLKTKRNWFRRAAFRKTRSVVVPSRVLEDIATNVWKVPPGQLQRISNGIDTQKFTAPPDPAGFRVVKRKGEYWIGTLAGLRPVKQLSLLVKAFERLPEEWHLVILGEGPDREAIQATADELEVSHRVHLPGAVTEPEKLIGLFDIFALSSKSEQFPLSVIEAMSAGLPVAAPDVGDIRSILPRENSSLLAKPNDAESLGAVLEKLAQDGELRARLGEGNREKALANFDEARMIGDYRALYWGAIEGKA